MEILEKLTTTATATALLLLPASLAHKDVVAFISQKVASVRHLLHRYQVQAIAL